MGSSSSISNNEKKTKVSYYAEVIFSLATLVYMAAWLRALASSRGQIAPFFIPSWLPLPNFSDKFVKDGFCNGHILFLETQFACFLFDVAMAVSLAISNHTSLMSLAIIGYLIVHGVAHQMIHMGLIDPEDEIEGPFKTTVLALIVMMGPAFFAFGLIQKKIPTWIALLSAGIAELGTVNLFLEYIKDGVWALTYINIAIFIWVFFPRIFLYPKDDETRLEIYDHSTTGMKLTLITVAVMYVDIFFEATLCDYGFDKVGGHVWFDVILFLVMSNVLPLVVESGKPSSPAIAKED